MIRLTRFHVSVLPTRDGLLLTWSPEDSTEDIHDYTFRVWRADARTGPWDIIADGLEDTYRMVDTNVDLTPVVPQHFYRIDVISKSDSSNYWRSDVETYQADVSSIASEIRLREAIYLKRVVGRKVFLLQRRVSGTRCGCWDTTLNKRLVSHCRTCYDTGWVGGYLNPVLIYVQFNPTEATLRFSPDMVDSPQATVAWTTYVPEIKPLDILAEENGTRWRVMVVQVSEQFRAPIRQVLSVIRVPPGDIEYDVPLGTDDVDDLVFFSEKLKAIRHS